MKDIISKEQLFNHSIQKVWDAITNQEQISTWFIPATFKAEKGFKYSFNASGDECSPIHGEVLEATPYTLIYSWIVTENPVETIVKWVLEEVEGGTKLYLEHSGISNYNDETAFEMFQSFNGGWDQCLTGLMGYLKDLVHAG